MAYTKQNTEPYIYKWTQLSTGMTYHGSKSKKGWNPSRHLEYICSSKLVKSMILENPSDWMHEILLVGDETQCKYIAELEGRLLRKLDARNDPLSYNQHNNDGLFSRTGTKHSENTKIKMSKSQSGENHWSYNKSDAYDFMKTNNPMFNLEISLQFSNRMLGELNPMKDQSTRDQMRQTRKDKGVAKGDKNPMKLPQHQYDCEHCGITCHKGVFNRWHGDNCKKAK